ncbi:MAG: XdhC/CoxI family protein [Anaerolineales bacterium]
MYQQILAAQQNSQAVAVCTVIRTHGSTPRRAGTKMLVYADGSFAGTIGGGEMEARVLAAAQQALMDGQTRILAYNFTDPTRGDPGVCGGQMEVFVEPILPEATVVVIGAGHVGKAVIHLAKWLGLRVIVSDDRAEFCTPEAAPGADLYLPVPLAELPQHLNIHRQTYLVLTTRGSSVDVAGLPALLNTPAAYIGIIGSRRRWETTRKALLESGIPEDALSRVHSPMGIEIHAETPEEIAVSILAQIIALYRG